MPTGVLAPTLIPPDSDLDDYFDVTYHDRYFYTEDASTIGNLPDKRLGFKKIPIKDFYLKVYSIIPGLAFGQLLIEDNNVWVRSFSVGKEITPWEMVYSTRNYDRLLIDQANNELDNISMQCGVFNNAGTGEQSFTFPNIFEGVPQVFCNCRGYDVDVYDVTATGFKYSLYKYESGSKSFNLTPPPKKGDETTIYAGTMNNLRFFGYSGMNIRQRDTVKADFTTVNLTAPENKTATVSSGTVIMSFAGVNYNNEYLYRGYETPIKFLATVKETDDSKEEFIVGTMKGTFSGSGYLQVRRSFHLTLLHTSLRLLLP